MLRTISELPLFHVERLVEKLLTDELRRMASKVGVEVSLEQSARLGAFLDLLLTWNRKVNLTSITDPVEAVESHLVDSLAAVPEVRAAKTVVDLGAGGGFPSIPLALVLPEVRFVLVDAVGKKVGFLKAAAAQLGVSNVRAVHARAVGNPEVEGIPRSEVAICRAFLPLPEWLALAPSYLEPGGSIVAMLGPEALIPEPLPAGMSLASERSYSLPRSGAARRIATFRI